MEKELYAWTMLAVAAFATYGWRYAAVLIGHRLNPNSPVFQWFGCVAYAIIGGLVARTLIFPVGMLAEVPVAYRLIAIGSAYLVFYGFGKRLWLAILVGVCTLLALVNFLGESSI